MKSLLALCVLQTMILLFLSSRVLMLETDVEALKTDMAASQTGDPAFTDRQPLNAPQADLVSSSTFPEETRLRKIISEELAAQLDGAGVVADTAQSRPVLESGPAYDRLRDSVGQSVDYYVSVGKISEQDMARLQQEIARLSPRDRNAAMMRIVAAVNNGQLDARL